jgi:hypothetical protein
MNDQIDEILQLMGVEDFPVTLTVGDVNIITKASSIVNDVADIIETLQSASRSATSMINTISSQYRYDEYIKHYPEDRDMIDERDAEKEKLLKNKKELDVLSVKIRNVINALFHDVCESKSKKENPLLETCNACGHLTCKSTHALLSRCPSYPVATT